MDIAATNKIRVAIGLAPLPVPGGGPTFRSSNDSESSSGEDEPGSTLESRQAEGYDNWRKLQDEAEAKAKREARNEAIKKARDVAQKQAKLEGTGLGEADETTELDTRSWLVQQKKRQKRLERDREKTRKLEEELRERENAVQYTGKDLAGVKVGHELREFEGDEEQVLVLKDTTIEENEEEGDELENLDMREREQLGERLNLKRKKPIYDPNDVEEAGEKVLLKQYDETIDGRKRKRFTLDAQGSTVEEREALKQTIGERLKAQPISLDILKDISTSDYVEVSEIKVKKPKKKKAKSTRQKPAEDDDIRQPPVEAEADEAIMDVDSGNTSVPAGTNKAQDQNISFVDDDDLQASLAKQRREALKRRKKLKPEDIARQLKEEEAENGEKSSDEPAEAGGLVIDETSEFVANLQRPTVLDKSTRTSSTKTHGDAPGASPSAVDEEGDVQMGHSYADDEDEGEEAVRLKREMSTPAQNGLTGTGLEEESTLSNGIGATLALLSQRGLINKEDTGDINALHRERQKFLAEKQNREAAAEQKARVQRERDRASGKLDRMSAREREEYARWENKQRDQAESRQMAEIFSREYKPDVQLKYVDEFGRSMNQKEAFKHLSHQFHGKGSGKQKTEKHLKKIDDEKKKEAQSSLDSSQTTGMNSALGATTKKNRQAGVRLA
ncbi:hypothetical protein MMC15_000911 [Xylographa vitiligo]|nr:hypothetical protein [Xylographa vitiligo]